MHTRHNNGEDARRTRSTADMSTNNDLSKSFTAHTLKAMLHMVRHHDCYGSFMIR